MERQRPPPFAGYWAARRASRASPTAPEGHRGLRTRREFWDYAGAEPNADYLRHYPVKPVTTRVLDRVVDVAASADRAFGPTPATRAVFSS